MKRLRRKTAAFRNARKPTTTSIFDSELEEEIKDILKQCGTHTATLSVRTQSGNEPSEHQIRTIVTADDPVPQQTTTDGEYIFHIASITKVLVATAVCIAVETDPTKGKFEERLQRFQETQHVPLTRVFNEYCDEKMKAIPGNPTIYNLLVHYKGRPSSNHRLLTPTGHPVMSLANVRDELLSQIPRNDIEDDTTKPWAGYSNVNYTVVAIAIEAIWGANLESFMNEILFIPLGMKCTSLGVPTEKPIDNKGWVVDSHGRRHELQRPQYRADGAEAAALGVYSTAHDLDLFFKFIIDTFHHQQRIPGFDLSALAKVLKITYETGESLRFTPLGLYTSLGSSVIGALSTNRAQFSSESFSKYNVTADQSENEIPIYYMAGSAVACSCATALHVGVDRSFAVIVLTNTSGPVDAADHILRLVLQRMANWIGKGRSSSRLGKPISVKEMVKRNWVESLQKWQAVEQKRALDRGYTPIISKDIEGLFKGENFNQRLVISKKADGRIYITVDGPLVLPFPTELELFWIDDSSVKMNIPLHLSVDWLDGGDWSNTVFRVEDRDRVVVALVRTTDVGEDKFLRISSMS